MRSGHARPPKAPLLKLLGPTLLLLLPLLLLGGSLAEAGLKPQTAGQAAVDPATSSHLVLRVYFHNTAERDSLATELDTLEIPTTGGYLTVVSDQAGVDSLRARGLRVEIDAEQTARLNTNVKFGNTPDNFFGGYHTVEEMQQFLDAEVSAHPSLAEKVDYGDSWCKAHPGQCTLPEPNNGYDLLALHISNRSIPGPKPVLWLEANIHAREIAPPEIAVDYISYLLDNYDSDADAHWLVDWHDIYVVPTLNPDGHHIVEAGGGGQNPYYQRKNANDTNGCTTWPPNIGDQFGTDLNRNFPFLWNCCGGSSAAPCSEAYHGAAAQSEDETQAVVSEVSSLIPDQRGPNITDAAPITTTGAFLDLHSFAGVNLYPWGMYETQAPNDTDLKNLAFHMSSTSAYPAGNDYTPCQFGPCLYIADGASNDWAYGELGAAAFAVEIGDEFFPPYTYTQSILWPQNRGMMLYMAKASRMPYLITRGPDATLVSSNPMTVTQGITSELSATINYAWDYHDAYSNYLQNVAAAEYYLDTPPWAGGTPVAMQAADGTFDEPVEAVQASVQTSSIPVGRHILFVRGRGVNSYEGYQSWGPVSASWLDVQPYASPTPTATGTPPTATPTSTIPPTGTPTSTPCSAPAMQNGGFETGSFTPGWGILDTEPTPIVSTAHTHSGSYAAFLGSIPNSEPSGDSSIYQQVTVPASGDTLSFWYYPYSRDNIQFDWQDAYITDLNGSILATVMHVLKGTETWTNVTYDLAAYAGQSIRVEFLVHQDGAGDVAHMYVDDVLLIEPCATPVPLTLTPTGTATVIATDTAVT
ncbi:MAG: M14 family zinc carboxypeptidase, partial [Chloroflexota bacterium]